MPNIIPPLLSSTPPPVIGSLDDDEDDEFGDFTTANDLSYEIEGISSPSTPDHMANKTADENEIPLDNNNKDKCFEKDFQDRRKSNSIIEDYLNLETKVVDKSNVQSVNESKEIPKNNVDDDYAFQKINAVLEVVNNSKENGCVKSMEIENQNIIDHEEIDVDIENDFMLNDAALDEDKEDSFESIRETTLNMNHLVSDVMETFACENALDTEFQATFEEFDPEFQLEDIDSNLSVQKDLTNTDYCKEEIDFNIDFDLKAESTKQPEENSTSVSAMEEHIKSCEKLAENVSDINLDDDFGDFADFEEFAPTTPTGENLQATFEPQQPEVTIQTPMEDEDFGDFDSYIGAKPEDCYAAYFEDVGAKSQRIFKEAFQTPSEGDSVESSSSNLEDSPVFCNLKDITETKALKFQWPESASQKMLLKSLNIDMRNILYGPGWNLSVPKFAAALSSSPLEPLKPEVITPSVSSVPDPLPNQEIPSVQFDWNSAGLTNPLDYSQNFLLDMEELVASLDSSNTCDLSDPWNIWLSSISSETDEKYLQPCTSLDLESQLQISSDMKSDLTMENTLLEATVDNTSIYDMNNAISVEDEFGPFESIKARNCSPVSMFPLRETHICSEKTPNISDTKSLVGDLKLLNATTPMPLVEKSPTETDDEFDDFQMSLPQQPTVLEVKGNTQKEEPFEVLTPKPVALEPLKPTVIQPERPKIEWPNPGLTEDDLNTIELTYKSCPLTQDISTESNREKSPASAETKSANNDDDDWTEFVSNTELKPKTSPTHNLQLSVLNLSQIRPMKPPVPVITPQGLVQTKLPTNTSIPTTQTPQPPSFVPQYQQDGYRPSIITTQYNKQFYGGLPPQQQVHYNGTAAFSQGTSKDDDDDWTDFISSAPPQKQAMGPNIYTNPGHYDVMGGYGRNVQQNGGVQKKSSVTSISALPDLEFVTRGRTFSKK